MNLLSKYSGEVTPYTVILCNRNHINLGLIQNPSELTVKINMNAADEITFTLYEESEPLWDKIEDFKYVLIPEIDYLNPNGEYFEIAVSYSVEDGGKKTITGVSAGECELGQINLYGVEINTETDIDRADYKVAKFWDEKTENQPNTLLYRVLKEVPNWSVGHVDASIAQLQRTFSIDGISIYDFLTQQAAQEFNCLFQFDSYDRVINVYDLYTVCTHKNSDGTSCGERGDFYQVCPKCGTDDELHYYGKDTTVYVDSENLSDNAGLEIDKDSVKNCFHLVAGDDNMTAAVLNCSPSNSSYIYYFSDEQKEDMSKELRDALDKYESDLKAVQPTYADMMEKYYDAIDKESYYENTMMPTLTPDLPTTTDEYEKSKLYADKLTNYNLSPIALDYISPDTSQATVENSIEEYAKVYVPTAYYEVEVARIADWNHVKNVSLPTYMVDPTYSYDEASNTGTWTGVLVVKNYNDETKPAFSQVLTISFSSANQEQFIRQKIEKMLTAYDYYQRDDYRANKDDRYMFNVLKLTDINKYKESIKLYCMTLLKDFRTSIEGCLDMLSEFSIGDGSDETDQQPEFQKLYNTYYQMREATEAEMNERQKQIDEQNALINKYQAENKEYIEKYDLKKYLTGDLYNEFCAFRREDEYNNTNYISDSLDTAKELFKRANEFYKEATKELKKASNYKYNITTDLANLLAIKEFEPLATGFDLGDWIRIRVDKDIFRLRFISYTVNFSQLDKIQVEFSDATKARIDDPYYSIKNVLDQARSMATSYSAVTRQVKNNSDKTTVIDNWVENGFDATKTKIVDNATNQGITIDQHGVLARRWSDINKKFDNKQLKLINNGIYITDDNWKTIKTALGNYYYQDPVTAKQTETYGLMADTIVGKFILGNKLSVQALGKDPITGDQNFVTFNVDSDGVQLNNSSFSLTADKKNALGHRNKIVLDPKFGLLMGDDRILDYSNGKYTIKSDYVNEDGTLKYNVSSGQIPDGASTYIDINTGNVIFNGSLHAYNGYFSGTVAQNKTSVDDDSHAGFYFDGTGQANMGGNASHIKIKNDGTVDINSDNVKFGNVFSVNNTGAKIAGFHLTDGTMYTGNKSSIDSEESGIYMDSNGNFAIGNGSRGITIKDGAMTFNGDISEDDLTAGLAQKINEGASAKEIAEAAQISAANAQYFYNQWVESGTTYIDGSKIAAGTITATQLSAVQFNTLTDGITKLQISGGNVNFYFSSDNICTGSIGSAAELLHIQSSYGVLIQSGTQSISVGHNGITMNGDFIATLPISSLDVTKHYAGSGNIIFGSDDQGKNAAVTGWVDDHYVKKSDRRVKDNIKTLDENTIIDIYNKINPVSFNYKNIKDPDTFYTQGTQFGFIAQEIESIIKPIFNDNSVVITKTEYLGETERKLCPDGLKKINYEEFHAFHVVYGHYLNKRINQLEAKLSELENKIIKE
jgi:hypothetical protein